MADVWDLAPAVSRDVWDLAPAVGGSVPGARQAKDIGDAIIAGLQSSATGLAVRGKLPDQQLGEDAPWYHRLAAGAAGVGADLPLSAVGGVAGALAGSAVLPVGGTILGGGAGAFAAPMALREALIEAYSHNYALSWEGAWEIAKAAIGGGTKGAVIGAATFGVGGLAGRTALTALAPGIGTATTAKTAINIAGATALGSELATLTATSAALEGKLPTWQDFMDNAILLGGVKGALHVAGGLRNIYADTGRTPEQVLGDAQRDPALKAELLGKTGEIPKAYQPLALEQRIAAAIDADARPEQIREALTADKPLDLTNPPLNNPVRGEYIVDNETHVGVMRLITEKYGPEIEAQRRGVVPVAQSLAEARDMLIGSKLGPHEVGAAANAAESAARNMLLRGAVIDVTKAAAEVREMTAAGSKDVRTELKLLAAIERLSVFKAEADGIRAEWGRAGQLMREMKRDPSALDVAEAYLKTAQRKGKLQDIAALAESFKDSTQMAEFAREYTKATTLEKVLYAWKSGILSGILTTGANLMGNVGKWAFDVIEAPVSASIVGLKRASHNDPLTGAQWKARAFAPLIGIQRGALDGLKVAAEVWKQKGEHLERVDLARNPISTDTVLGKVVNIPYRLLSAQDAFFRTMAERAEAYKLAVDRVAKEDLHPSTQEGREAVEAYTQRPDLGLSEKEGAAVMTGIEEAGAEAVFAQRLGPLSEKLANAIGGTPVEFLVPFRRTPANLVSWAMQHAPGLNLLSGRWREDMAAGGERQARAIARIAAGTALSLTAYSLAQSGLITGSGLFDKEMGGTKRAAGWQQNSFLIDGKYYSYARIEPIAKVIGLAADLVEILQATKDKEDKAKVGVMLALMFGNATVSTTYLSGLANFMQGVTDPERYGSNLMEQYATSLVPKIIGQTVGMADPYKREVDGIADALFSQLPWLREKLLPKIDVWGQPVKNDRWFDVMPVTVTEASSDKVKTEAVRLSVAIADAPRFAQEKGPFNPKDKRVELTGEQRNIHREVAGKFAMEILKPIVNAPDWEGIPDFAKAAIYKGVLEAGRRQGMQAALPADSAERDVLRHKIIDRVIKETQDADLKVAPTERTVK